MRIDKFLSECGLASRKESAKAAKSGGITVNGAVVKDTAKHIDPEKHRQLTGHDNRRILAFAKYLEEKRIPLWVRHIIVEGYTDDGADLTELGRFIGSLSNLKALDVLPYHTMGVSKYKTLGIPYPLEGVPALTVSDAVKAKEHIMEGIRQVKIKKQSD